MKKIVIGCTRAGLTLKKALISFLENKGFAIEDVGMKEGGEFVPYHKAAMAVAEKISCGEYDKGIIICGTGAGSVITAAKFKGVYPVHVTNTMMAQKAKVVNDCNALVFGEWFTPPQHAFALVDAWLETMPGDGETPEWKEFLAGCRSDIARLEEEKFK
ncbi:MAG: RpiB/LacA/LacB family sugar-phosphate isomerase [Candidatus Cryptobacteroides sp.]|jgi:ribose 5-phosphate isomerase B